jgi:hypothetical protein
MRRPGRRSPLPSLSSGMPEPAAPGGELGAGVSSFARERGSEGNPSPSLGGALPPLGCADPKRRSPASEPHLLASERRKRVTELRSLVTCVRLRGSERRSLASELHLLASERRKRPTEPRSPHGRHGEPRIRAKRANPHWKMEPASPRLVRNQARLAFPSPPGAEDCGRARDTRLVRLRTPAKRSAGRVSSGRIGCERPCRRR